jgi:hypothetical protein
VGERIEHLLLGCFVVVVIATQFVEQRMVHTNERLQVGDGRLVATLLLEHAREFSTVGEPISAAAPRKKPQGILFIEYDAVIPPEGSAQGLLAQREALHFEPELVDH